jgi:hypothetical protein
MNPNELNLSHRRPVELVQEAENGRLTRGLRKERPRFPPRRPGAGDVWLGSTRRSHCGGTNVPFFRA